MNTSQWIKSRTKAVNKAETEICVVVNKNLVTVHLFEIEAALQAAKDSGLLCSDCSLESFMKLDERDSFLRFWAIASKRI